MDILILKDEKGWTARLTTESPASHYGIPILQITADDVDGDFGPSDIIGTVDKPDELLTAAQIVYAWGTQRDRREEEREAARSFLRQWPEGPQI